jgi:diguanylate cyclase (GGDEF)-like protein/PAS domain S-box-containing protein
MDMDTSEKVRHILVIEDPSVERNIDLDGATYSIGRHSSNDIVLSCQKTSRNHATLLRRTDVKTNKYAYWVLDGDLQGNRSRNGIYINGKKCLVHELKHGDVIKFSGDAQARYKIASNFSAIVAPISNNSIPEDAFLIDSKKTLVNKDTELVISQESREEQKYSESFRQNSFAELSPQPIIEIDLYGNITYVNSAAAISFKDIGHQKLDHPLLNNLISQYHNHDNNILIREVKIGNRTFKQQAHYLLESKTVRIYIVEITEQKILEHKLQEKETLYNNIVEQITEGIIIVDGSTKQIVEANKAAFNLLGYSQEELLTMTVYDLSLESEKFAIILQKIIAEKSNFFGNFLLRHQNGATVNANLKIDLISSQSTDKLCLVLEHQDEQKRLSENILGIDLSKRDIFEKQLLTAIANAKRNQKLLAVMFCRLNFLPDIRDTIGIQKTNQLLANLGERLSTCLRSGDTVIHWQEDKFALLMPQISGIEEVAKISQRIQNSIEQSFKIGNNQFTVKSNTGIAIYPQDGTEQSILLDHANTALDRACQNDRNSQFYDGTMNSQALVALELETLLHQALEKEEFKLYYQPQIDVNNGQIQGIGALLRWEHPELGLVSPASFIKLAEQNRLIIPIGEWAIRTACFQNKTWQSQGLPPLRISVNLSPVQFQQPNLPLKIEQILNETELEGHLLELEIAASTLIENVEYSRHILTQLQELGIHISVDDLPSGFSAIEYLKQLPFNTLKIDRSLVQGLTDNPKDLAIIAALVELGKGFNLRVVAEGVETQEQIELLRSLNCEQMQGFWFSRPLAATEASKLLPLNYQDDLKAAKSDLNKLI